MYYLQNSRTKQYFKKRGKGVTSKISKAHQYNKKQADLITKYNSGIKAIPIKQNIFVNITYFLKSIF